MDGYIVGQAAANALVAGIRSRGPFLQRLAHQMAEAAAFTRAERSERHADWFCSLPWYRQWWALVTGR